MFLNLEEGREGSVSATVSGSESNLWPGVFPGGTPRRGRLLDVGRVPLSKAEEEREGGFEKGVPGTSERAPQVFM